MSKSIKRATFEPFEGVTTGGRHVRLTLSMLKHPAWKALKPIAAKLYVYLKHKYRGDGDAKFTCTYKEINSVVGFSDRSIKAAFDDLIEKGFIVLIDDNRRRMKANVYKFSNRWSDYGSGVASGFYPPP